MAIVKRETDYALRALGKLGQTDDFLSVSALAEGEGVPEVFLRKIMQRLHSADVVESRQGPFGGYRLARPAGEVTLLEVIEVVQGPLVMNECFGAEETCERRAACSFRARLAEMQVDLNARLDGITLAELVSELPTEEGATR